VPILFSFSRIAYIAQTYSLITAICDLNIEVLRKYSCRCVDWCCALINPLQGKLWVVASLLFVVPLDCSLHRIFVSTLYLSPL
jgi:hypothetical protein